VTKKIITAIRTRLGGNKYKKVKKYCEVKRFAGYPFKDNPLKQLLIKDLRINTKEFFLSGLTTRAARSNYPLELYTYLCDNYTYSEDNSCFNFGGAIIPKPDSLTESKTFLSEFIDIVCAYLLNDDEFCNLFYLDGPYEYDNVSINTDGGDVVIDCGANIGMFSAIASQKGATVYAFEPHSHVIEKYLAKTAKWNPNINICRYALMDYVGTTTFSQSADHIGASRVTSIEKSTNTIEYAEDIEVVVQTITLDKFVEENNISRIDFIKADIEGAERYMLMGAGQVLKEFAPKLSLCTYHLPDDPQILRNIILQANPNYVIEERLTKMYAYVN
jgi:FkbM family methyltransferase